MLGSSHFGSKLTSDNCPSGDSTLKARQFLKLQRFMLNASLALAEPLFQDNATKWGSRKVVTLFLLDAVNFEGSNAALHVPQLSIQLLNLLYVLLLA